MYDSDKNYTLAQDWAKKTQGWGVLSPSAIQNWVEVLMGPTKSDSIRESAKTNNYVKKLEGIKGFNPSFDLEENMVGESDNLIDFPVDKKETPILKQNAA